MYHDMNKYNSPWIFYEFCEVFSEPRSGEEKYGQMVKCPRVLSVKPSDNNYSSKNKETKMLHMHELWVLYIKRDNSLT